MNEPTPDDQHPHQGTQYSPPASEESTKTQTPEESLEELKQAVQGSNEVLSTATTALPFFPDTITLDRAKLTVTKRTFVRSAEIMSMRIEDILNVTSTVGPIFGTVKITSRAMSAGDPSEIGPFWRKEALRFKRVAQGYVIALQREIDCNALPAKELVKMLDKLGEDEHPS